MQFPHLVKNFFRYKTREKIHEEMITESDGYNCVDLGKYYAILPNRDKFLNIYKKIILNMNYLQKGFHIVLIKTKSSCPLMR